MLHRIVETAPVIVVEVLRYLIAWYRLLPYCICNIVSHIEHTAPNECAARFIYKIGAVDIGMAFD